MGSGYTVAMMDGVKLEKALRERIKGEVRFDYATRLLYSTDASNYQIIPVGVVLPRSVEDVEAAVRIAAEEHVPVLPRGGGTGLSGQTVGSAIVIDFSKYMNHILSLDPDRRRARVETGVVLRQLNRAIEPQDLVFGPDPATANRCNLGGMIGNNSCGPHSVVYGKTVDHVMRLTSVLADGSVATFAPLPPGEFQSMARQKNRLGEIYATVGKIAREHAELINRRFPQVPRRVSGYNLDAVLDLDSLNLAKLIVGSEGTLATVVEAELDLSPRPRHRSLLVLSFESLRAALDCVSPLLDYAPVALEIVDDKMIGIARTVPDFSDCIRFIPTSTRGALIAEFAHEDAEVVREMAVRVQEAAPRLIGTPHTYLIIDPQAQRDLWAVREAGLGLLGRKVGDTKPIAFVEDTGVDPHRLGEYVTRFQQMLTRYGAEADIYGHAGQGCLHIRVNVNLKTADGVRTMRDIAEASADLVVEFGGSLSGEHGDGLARSEFLERMFGPDVTRLFKQVKQSFDPEGIMNPGKIVDPEAMDTHLRYGPDYVTKEPATYFDFSYYKGFHRAVEMCTGIGACRKTDAGTMCPSYMVTRDEQDSTRGRANALREAMSGNLAGFGDHQVVEILDLCLECKGCKRECPIGVDMAKYKAEYLAQYYDLHGRPLRNRAFGRLRTAARIAQPMAGLVNTMQGGPLGSIIKRLLGIHPARKLPALSGENFRRWFKGRTPAHAGAGPEVVLMDDTFNSYFGVPTLKAAVRVLERAGFRVLLPTQPVCCGRPLISKGLLKEARRYQAQLLNTLAPPAERGPKIVGLEPSCLLTLRDELPDLVRDRRSESLARNSLLIEEFLAKEAPDYRPGAWAGEAILHGHCHQKAIAGMESVKQVLDRVAGLKCTLLDSGCCGMAGSFGYEAEHYEISRAVGERVLLPAVRAATPQTLILADGFSCRSQIEDFTARSGLHVVDFLAGLD